jgi:hypothetical protein
METTLDMYKKLKRIEREIAIIEKMIVLAEKLLVSKGKKNSIVQN